MTIINTLSLSSQETNTLQEKIKERITGPLNLAANFSELTAHEVDFSAVNNNSVQKMGNTVGKQFIVPIKTHEGMDGEALYSEVDGVWLSNVSTKTKDSKLLNKLQAATKTNEKYQKLVKKLENEGYTLHDKEKHVIKNSKYVEQETGSPLTESQNILAIPVQKNQVDTGMVILSENDDGPVFMEGEEYTFFQEGEGIVTVQADACSLSWAECMHQQFGDCDTFPSCLVKYGSCIGACCTCFNPLSCVVCVSCALGVALAAWNCRMCVPNAARPEECPAG